LYQLSEIAERKTILDLWELLDFGEDKGIFWWFHHQNIPTYPVCHRRFPKTLSYSRIHQTEMSYTHDEYSGLIVESFSIQPGASNDPA
jgi:hypothetical protein